MSYSIAGNVYLIPASRIKSLEGQLTGTEAMKFAISGGVTKLDEEINDEILKEEATHTK
jgi:uncharacterized membrane protein